MIQQHGKWEFILLFYYIKFNIHFYIKKNGNKVKLISLHLVKNFFSYKGERRNFETLMCGGTRGFRPVLRFVCSSSPLNGPSKVSDIISHCDGRWNSDLVSAVCLLSTFFFALIGYLGCVDKRV